MGILSRLLPKKQSGGSFALALDVGTSMVKALIFHIDGERRTGEVIGVGRKKQGLADMQSGAVSDIAAVVANAEEALTMAEDMAQARAEQVILGIAGELVKGKTTTVHYERLTPISKIDIPELKNIIQKVQWKAFEEVRKQLAWETGMPEIDVKLINAAIVEVKIDGYAVTNPVGFQGKDVEIGIFNAYAPLVHLGALQTIARELNLDLLSIAAEPYAVARSIGVEDSVEFNAIVMDVGGGTTDIAVVRSGGIEGTKMFALGGRAFTRRLATVLHVAFEEAERIKLKYSEGKLPPELTKKVKQALEADAGVWLSGVELALADFSHHEPLPTKILLCGGGSNLPEIKRALGGTAWQNQLAFPRKPSIHFIKPQEVSNIADRTGQLTTAQDITPMALANIALDLAGEESMAQGILRRVVRMMQT